MGLSQALATASAGLRTTQAGISLVAANVANAGTPGYIRKTLNQEATSAGEFGVSVRAAGINRELDRYLQDQLRTETSGGAYADLRSQFCQRLQQIYGDPGSSSSFETSYSNFTTALQALTANPSDYSVRAGVLSSAQLLAQQLNGLTRDIQGLRSEADQGIANAVGNANDALQRIAQINQQLAANPDNATAASLLDQRDHNLDQLSQLMDIRVSENSNNQIDVFTSTGIQIVGNKAAQLSFNDSGTLTPDAQWNADPAKSRVGTITLVSATGASFDLVANNTIRSGQIAAYVEMRDKTLVQAQSQIDEFAAAMSRALSDQTVDGVAVNSGAQTGYAVDIGGLQPGNAIDLTYTDVASSTQRTVTIIRVDDPAALPLANSVTTNPNDQVIGVDWTGGLASVVSQLNSAFGGRLQFSNPAGTTLRVLDDGAVNKTNVDAVSATSTATSLAGGTPELPFFTDGSVPFSGAITGGGSQATGLAGRIAVNSALLADPSKLVAYQATTPSGDSTRPNFIYDQLTTAAQSFSPQTGIGTLAAPFSGSLASFMRQVMSQQGDAAASAKNLSDGQDMVVKSLRQRFDDSSGVNIDVEMSNLLILQTTYGANARVMTAVKALFDMLLNS